MQRHDRHSRRDPRDRAAAGPREGNLLKNAPHTAADLADDSWQRPYTRTEASFPAGTSPGDKYWSPVNRIDNAYGDRHLMCVCPPFEMYQPAAE